MLYQKQRYNKHNQLTVQLVRKKYGIIIRNDQIQQIFRSVRNAIIKSQQSHVPISPMYMPIPQPVIFPQLNSQQILYLQHYIKHMASSQAPVNLLQILPPEQYNQIILNQQQQVEEVEVPTQQEIYFEKDNYRIYKKLVGEGTFSKVWEGIDLITKNKVAAKQIKKLDDVQAICLKGFNSPHIIKILAILRHRNYSYIILQFCQKNLRDQLTNCKYQLAKILNYFDQIVDGMSVLQDRNFIHRDLKFQNILLSKGVIKLADFGLAKSLGDEMQIQSRRCGSPYTMAPQIYFSTNYLTPYTSKCDIWSLGIILHEMLYEKHPFNKNKMNFKNQQRIKIRKKYGLLDKLIDKCLIFQPKNRIDWAQFLNIYNQYQKNKQRYQNAQLFPIQVQSIIYQQQTHRKRQFKFKNSHSNNIMSIVNKETKDNYIKIKEECQQKMLNDYNVNQCKQKIFQKQKITEKIQVKNNQSIYPKFLFNNSKGVVKNVKHNQIKKQPSNRKQEQFLNQRQHSKNINHLHSQQKSQHTNYPKKSVRSYPKQIVKQKAVQHNDIIQKTDITKIDKPNPIKIHTTSLSEDTRKKKIFWELSMIGVVCFLIAALINH